MSFKTPIICDRRVYDKKGSWKSPNNDFAENVFYFVKEPLTLVPSFVNGREQFKETMTITCFGAKQFCKDDIITLDTGKTFRIQEIVANYIEHNILVKDLLKPRVESCDLRLE